MNEAIFGLVGVVIGAVIGIVTTYMQNQNNVDMFILQKRTEAYLPIIEKYLKASWKQDTDSQKEMFNEFQRLTPELLLYGSNKVKNQTEIVKEYNYRISFYQSINKPLHKDDIINDMREFVILIELMRSELKIK